MTIATSAIADDVGERAALAGASGAARRAATLLVESAFVGAPHGRARRLGVADDGSPFLLSHKSARVQSQALRLHVEPGRPSLRVSEQIDLALYTLARVFTTLGWSRCAPSVNAATTTLFPADAQIVDGWWGGIGLGVEADAHATEIRAYVNLRDGDVRACWQRFGAFLCALDESTRLLDAFGALIERCRAYAVPVGVALAWRDDRLSGVRLYLGMIAPNAADLVKLGAIGDAAFADALGRACDDYEAAVRHFGFTSITCAFDFAMHPNGLHLAPVRFKADFDCYRSSRDETERRAWLRRTHAAFGLSTAACDAFLASLDASFGGSFLNYVSIGARAGAPEITTYCIPRGFGVLHDC